MSNPKISKEDVKRHSVAADELHKTVARAIQGFITFKDADPKTITDKDILIRSDIAGDILNKFSGFILASTLETYGKDADQKEELLQKISEDYKAEIVKVTRDKIKEIQALKGPSH